MGPDGISNSEAEKLFYCYAAAFNPGLTNTTNVLFEIGKMGDMVQEMKDIGATHIRVYFGATGKEDGNGNYYFQPTTFFQAVEERGSENYQDMVEDLSTTPKIYTSYDIGHPCPPPKCPGSSIFY